MACRSEEIARAPEHASQRPDRPGQTPRGRGLEPADAVLHEPDLRQQRLTRGVELVLVRLRLLVKLALARLQLIAKLSLGRFQQGRVLGLGLELAVEQRDAPMRFVDDSLAPGGFLVYLLGPEVGLVELPEGIFQFLSRLFGVFDPHRLHAEVGLVELTEGVRQLFVGQPRVLGQPLMSLLLDLLGEEIGLVELMQRGLEFRPGLLGGVPQTRLVAVDGLLQVLGVDLG